MNIDSKNQMEYNRQLVDHLICNYNTNERMHR